MQPSAESVPKIIKALSHEQRLRIIAVLMHGRQYVSELARLLGISRPLLYLHLEHLEAAQLVSSELELSSSGKAVRWYELEDFDIHLTPSVIAEAAGSPHGQNTTDDDNKGDPNV